MDWIILAVNVTVDKSSTRITSKRRIDVKVTGLDMQVIIRHVFHLEFDLKSCVVNTIENYIILHLYTFPFYLYRKSLKERSHPYLGHQLELKV